MQGRLRAARRLSRWRVAGAGHHRRPQAGTGSP